MTRVVHFSDWHAQLTKLPSADVYVCSGDMLPNFPNLIYEVGPDRHREVLTPNDPRPALVGEPIDRRIVPEQEVRLQTRWIHNIGSYRTLLGSPDAPVICVRGNHDFIDIANMFDGGPVYEFHTGQEVFEVAGLRWGGCRGINYIEGEWSDELRFEQTERFLQLPKDIDCLVTHPPPFGILDRAHDNYGVQALRNYVMRHVYKEEDSGYGRLRAHFFGHVHEARGTRNEDGILFSNAATTFIASEI